MRLNNKYKVRQKIYSNGELFSNDITEDFFYSLSECYEFIYKCKELDKIFYSDNEVVYIIEDFHKKIVFEVKYD